MQAAVSEGIFKQWPQIRMAVQMLGRLPPSSGQRKVFVRQVENVKPAHRKPIHVRDYIAYGLVQFSRWSFDKITGYSPKTSLTPEGWLQRFIFLETVAGVPGMVGAMLRHMMSLRTLKRDHGWIHTLLEEAENERMHLLTFLKLREPGIAFRLAVLGAQGVFFNAFFLSYLISPRTCHRFVGYLEEEAVRTYTHALHDIDGGGESHDDSSGEGSADEDSQDHEDNEDEDGQN